MRDTIISPLEDLDWTHFNCYCTFKKALKGSINSNPSSFSPKKKKTPILHSSRIVPIANHDLKGIAASFQIQSQPSIHKLLLIASLSLFFFFWLKLIAILMRKLWCQVLINVLFLLTWRVHWLQSGTTFYLGVRVTCNKCNNYYGIYIFFIINVIGFEIY